MIGKERSPMAATDRPDQPDHSLHRLATEQSNAMSVAIDQMTPLQIVQVMNAEDTEVAAAVARELPSIAAAVEAIADRLRSGGRLI